MSNTAEKTYLRTRTIESGRESNLMQAQQPSMQQVWDSPDDEVWNDLPTSLPEGTREQPQQSAQKAPRPLGRGVGVRGKG